MFQASDVKKLARSTVTDPSATNTEKSAARKAIGRIDAHKQNKVELAESCGKKPTRKAFTNDEEGERLYRLEMSAYWDLLDARAVRKQAENILNDKDSTPLQRHNARARLEALDGPSSPPEDVPDEKRDSSFPTREDFGFLNGLTWPEFVASGKEAEFQAALAKWRETAPPLDPKLAAFFNSLDDACFDVPARIVSQSVTPKTSIAPPIDPSLFCEYCGVGSVSPVCALWRMLRRNETGINRDQFGLCS